MKLKAPKGVSSFSHGGEEIEVKKGLIDVEGDALAAAMSLGFTVPGAKAQADEQADEQSQDQADPVEQPQQPQE